MNTSSTIIAQPTSGDLSRDDEILVWLWERHEAGLARDLHSLWETLRTSFPSADPGFLDKLFQEFAGLANFPAIADGVAESRPEVLRITSFSHFRIVDSDDPTMIRRGGLASVHKAIDTRFDRSVAIKVPLERFAKDAEVCGRLEREAAISATLQHPNIVPIYEIGVYEPAGCPFFAMKYVEGATLLHCMGAASPPFSQLRLLRAIREVCSALEHAHANGIIHCDLKPENVMIGEFGEVHLLDWGFARSAQVADYNLTARRKMMERFFQTATSGVFGTLAYMSPEQAHGSRNAVSPKSDVFGVGGILYHLLAGKPVYSGTQDAMLKMAMNCDTRLQLTLLDATRVPNDLKSLVRSCLNPSPEQRPTIREVGQSIDSWLENLEQASFLAEQRARRMTIAFATSIVALVVFIAAVVLFRQYQKSVVSELTDVAAVEAQASMLLDHAVKLRQHAMKKDAIDRRDESIGLTNDARRLAEQSLSMAQPISAMPEIAKRAETLLREMDNDREFAELQSQELRLKVVAAKRDDSLIDSLNQGADLNEALFLECLCGVRLEILPEFRSFAFHQAFINYGIDWSAQGIDQIISVLAARPKAWRSDVCTWLDLWAHDSERLQSLTLLKKIIAVQKGIEPESTFAKLREGLVGNSNAMQDSPQTIAAKEEIRRSIPSALLVAIKLIDNGKIDLGTRLLCDLALSNPQSVLANRFSGILLSEQKDAAWDSFMFLNSWRTNDPKRGKILVTLLTASGRETDALVVCESIRASGGLTPELAVIESLCWSRIGDDQRALAVLKDISLIKQKSLLVRLGVPIVLLRLGRADEAEALTAMHISAHPEQKLLYLVKGMIHQHSGESIAAVESFRTALDSLQLEVEEKSRLLVAFKTGHQSGAKNIEPSNSDRN